MYQFNIVFGILVAFLSNFLFANAGFGESAWRWMIGIEALPAFIYTLMVMTVPMSPRWLMMKGRYDEAREVLRQIDPTRDVNDLIEAGKEDTSHSSESIWLGKYRLLVWLAVLIAFFNQSPASPPFCTMRRGFLKLPVGQNAALLSSVGVGVVNLIFTLLGLLLIDKLGRRTLMYICSFGYIISLGLISMAFLQQWGGIVVPLLFFLFIAAMPLARVR